MFKLTFLAAIVVSTLAGCYNETDFDREARYQREQVQAEIRLKNAQAAAYERQAYPQQQTQYIPVPVPVQQPSYYDRHDRYVRDYDDRRYSREQPKTVVNKTVINKTTIVQAPEPQKPVQTAAPKSYAAPAPQVKYNAPTYRTPTPVTTKAPESKPAPSYKQSTVSPTYKPSSSTSYKSSSTSSSTVKK